MHMPPRSIGRDCQRSTSARAVRVVPVVLALLTLSSGVSVRAQVPQQFAASPYGRAIAAYRTGDTEGGVAQLLMLGDEGLRFRWETRTKVRSPAVYDPEPLELRAGRQAGDPTIDQARAGAMLHTDAIDALWSSDRSLALRHLTMARHWADFTATYLTESDQGEPFRRRWYLASGLLLAERGVRNGGVEQALDHLDTACALFPDDVPLATAAAWLDERAALAPVDRSAFDQVGLARDPWDPRANPTRERDRLLERAADRLVAALEATPSAVAPSLRLGRIESLRGHATESIERLTALVGRRDLDPDATYLAHLFLARALTERGELSEAQEHYRQAIQQVPRAQSAVLGLARLVGSTGDARGARDVLAPSLDPTTEGGTADPWIDYLVGYLDRASAVRTALRVAVQR